MQIKFKKNYISLYKFPNDYVRFKLACFNESSANVLRNKQLIASLEMSWRL